MTDRSKEFQALYDRARSEGLKAGNSVHPTPMVVVEHKNMLDDTSPAVRQYAPVMGGVCGFAWVAVKPATSSFARWARAQKLAETDSYAGGLSFWVRDFGQSYERKLAYAQAFADVLAGAGLRAYVRSRLD